MYINIFSQEYRFGCPIHAFDQIFQWVYWQPENPESSIYRRIITILIKNTKNCT